MMNDNEKLHAAFIDGFMACVGQTFKDRGDAAVAALKAWLKYPLIASAPEEPDDCTTPFDDHEAVAEKLNSLGWRSLGDAQWDHLREWCKELKSQWLAKAEEPAGLRERERLAYVLGREKSFAQGNQGLKNEYMAQAIVEAGEFFPDAALNKDKEKA